MLAQLGCSSGSTSVASRHLTFRQASLASRASGRSHLHSGIKIRRLQPRCSSVLWSALHGNSSGPRHRSPCSLRQQPRPRIYCSASSTAQPRAAAMSAGEAGRGPEAASATSTGGAAPPEPVPGETFAGAMPKAEIGALEFLKVSADD